MGFAQKYHRREEQKLALSGPVLILQQFSYQFHLR